MKKRTVYCCDIGSTLPRKNGDVCFAWAKSAFPAQSTEIMGGSGIASLASSIEADFVSGTPVAIGFEAPLSVPVPSEVESLSRARGSEGSRSWSAPGVGHCYLGHPSGRMALSAI